MAVKLLTEQNLEFLSLTRGCTGFSESTLVKMPHCWKSHVTAHLISQKLLSTHVADVDLMVIQIMCIDSGGKEAADL